MSLVGSARIRKIEQSFRVCSALGTASIARVHAIEVVARRAALLLALVVTVSPPTVAFAQGDERRPVRQVETDDGVIEITNSNEVAAEPVKTDELTSVRALRAVERSGVESANGAPLTSESSLSTTNAQRRSHTSSSWGFPLLVLIVAASAGVWGIRRRTSRKAAVIAREPAAGESAQQAELLPELDDVLDADMLDEPEPLAGPGVLASPPGQLPPGQLCPPGQWVDAVRDSVPPSSPPRSSRGSNAPRQWVSQSLRVKSDES
jgi:hypothetical protein